MNTMRLTEYQKLSMRTAPAFRPRTLTPIQDFINHAVIGVTTEIAEIIEDKDNTENVLQEIGDVLWYLGLGCTGIGVDLEGLPRVRNNYDDVYDELVTQGGKLNDCVKRHIYYSTIDKPVELDEVKFCKAVSAILYALDDLSDGRLEECMILNVEKLRLRYPDKFDADKAVNRNVENENQLFK